MFNDETFAASLAALEQQQRQQMDGVKLLALRRHTMGPGQTPMYLDGTAATAFPLPYHDVLPQTNLTQNLPLVSNLPPENFSVKDPHLLKPPAALGVTSSQHGRRASDGGAYFGQFPMAAEAPASIGGSSHSSGDESQDGRICFVATPSLLEASVLTTASTSGSPIPSVEQQQLSERSESPLPYSVQVEYHLSRSGSGKRLQSATVASGLPDSPRKRRTGLDTVMEPPEIPPELAKEVEVRMKSQSPVNLLSLDASASPSPSSLINPPSPFPGLSPMTSPSKPGGTSPVPSGGLRQRRTGLSSLSTVMEIGKTPVSVTATSSLGLPGTSVSSSSSTFKEPHSLQLPMERFSPVRRLSEGSPSFLQHRNALSQQSSLPSSNDASPSDLRALQEECRRLQETSGSNNASNESGFISSPSSNFLLRPPSPGDNTGGHLSLPRRSSDSGVNQATDHSATGGHRLRPSVSSHSATSEPLQALYDEMYNTDHVNATPSTAAASVPPTVNTSRRFSYPNSPVHTFRTQPPPAPPAAQPTAQLFQSSNSPIRDSKQQSSLTQHLQSLCIQQKISNDDSSVSGGGKQGQQQRFKGSITQGVPSRKVTSPARGGSGLTRGHSLKAHSNLASASQQQQQLPSLASQLSLGSGSSLSNFLAHSHSFDESVPAAVAPKAPALPSWGRHHSVCQDEYISLAGRGHVPEPRDLRHERERRRGEAGGLRREPLRGPGGRRGRRAHAASAAHGRVELTDDGGGRCDLDRVRFPFVKSYNKHCVINQQWLLRNF